MSSAQHIHSSHPSIIKRLKRADGHLKKVILMIESGQPCLDIAQQLQAVEGAVANAKRTLIEDHLDHCLDDVVGPMTNAQRHEVEALKKIARYL